MGGIKMQIKKYPMVRLILEKSYKTICFILIKQDIFIQNRMNVYSCSFGAIEEGSLIITSCAF